ncbi:cytochrome b5-like heme/Steroid binding domain-containing protein [Phthorimaea operculella]|nr:cytochrome b5-like heme/Steroid binding domain-containing protein [Phthorimaea operculella]
MGDQRYTRADVAGRNGRNGAPVWIIIKDVVYDVTPYLAEHPGGDDVLLGEAGKDATREFESVGHSSDAKSVMKKYRIGQLVEEEKHYDENGKKKKASPQVASSQPQENSRSCMNIISCGLMG